MKRKVLILAAALVAGPMLTMSVMSQTMPGDAPTTAPAATEASTQASTAAPKELTTAISKGIDLLTAGKLKETIELLAPPDDVAKEKASGNFDKMVDEFKSGGMDAKLLTALKATTTQTPKLSDDSKDATYPKVSDDTPPLEFVKINDTWYLK